MFVCGKATGITAASKAMVIHRAGVKMRPVRQWCGVEMHVHLSAPRMSDGLIPVRSMGQHQLRQHY